MDENGEKVFQLVVSSNSLRWLTKFQAKPGKLENFACSFNVNEVESQCDTAECRKSSP